MERRSSRVSVEQWDMLLKFLEENPALARGYNNTSQGRRESARLWQEVAKGLNATGTKKSPKEWAVYVSNYKSKMKKTVADFNTDASGTGGGPPRGSTLSDHDTRLLAILGSGFGQAATRVRVDLFPAPISQPSTSGQSPVREEPVKVDGSGAAPPLPQRVRRTRRCSRRPKRIVSQVEMQRAAADSAQARALHLIGQNLGRLASAAERYLDLHFGPT